MILSVILLKLQKQTENMENVWAALHLFSVFSTSASACGFPSLSFLLLICKSVCQFSNCPKLRDIACSGPLQNLFCLVTQHFFIPEALWAKKRLNLDKTTTNLPKRFRCSRLVFYSWPNKQPNFFKLCNYGLVNTRIFSTILKTSARVSSGFPNTKNSVMKARGHRPSAFIIFE